MLLKMGDSGGDVRGLQLALRAIGYPLSGTGYFGPSTDSAVEDFQRKYGMPVTGEVDDGVMKTIAKAAGSAPPRVAAPLWLTISLANVGLKEGAGSKNNSELVADIKTVAPDYQTDATPWCAGWVSFCLARADIKPSKTPLWALSYAEGWGVRLRGPALGAIAVKTRAGGGHVTFVAGRTRGGALACCGGNQNDSVSVAPYAEAAFNRGFFWPNGVPLPALVGIGHLPIVDTAGRALSEA